MPGLCVAGHFPARWRNGSASDFGSEGTGSIPVRATMANKKYINPDARALYAGFAMIGILAEGSIIMPSIVAEKAVQYADALIERLVTDEDDGLEERVTD